MEKLQTETPSEPRFNISRRRKSHLQSQTYLNFVRILSGCYEHPQLCKTPQIITEQLPSDDDINVPSEVFQKQVFEHSEMVSADGADHSDSLVQNSVTSKACQKQGFEHCEKVSADGTNHDYPLVQNNVTCEVFQKQGFEHSESVSISGTGRDHSLVQNNVPSETLQKQGFDHCEMVSANGTDRDDSLVQNNVPSEVFQKQGFERSEMVSANCADHDDSLVQNNELGQVFQEKQGFEHSEKVSADGADHDDCLVQNGVSSEGFQRNSFEHGNMVPADVADHDDSLVQNNTSGEVFQKEGSELGNMVSADDADHWNSLVQNDATLNKNVDTVRSQDGGFTNTQDLMNEMENIMRIEENIDTFENKKLVVDGDTDKSNDVEDKGFFQLQQLLMDELEHVMKGNEEIGHDKNCNFPTFSLDENQCDGDADAILSDQAKHPQPIEDSGNVEGVHQVEIECASQNTFAMMESSLDKRINCEDPMLNNKVEEESSSLRSNELGGNHEMQQKEMNSGKSVSSVDAKVSSNIIEDGETEEGQIAGGFIVNDRLVDMSGKDSAVPQEPNKQLSEVEIYKNRCPSNDKEKLNRRESISITASADMSNVTSKREVEANDVRNAMACKRKVIVYEDPILAQEPVVYKKQKTGCEKNERKKDSSKKGRKKGNVGSVIVLSNNLSLSAKKSNQDASGRQGSASNEKLQQDSGMCNKKKRGPPSEEKKQKKKEKKRRKRAEKNRELGVKRLRLRPVEKPKPVVYCRHYIKGRCQEGEKCKFSHDTIPLTKSKPCCHFARNACLKGDDCPYDHQLSKYPCSNYASSGFCSRGDDCLFSHKLPIKEDLPSTSNVGTPDLKSLSLPQTSNSKKQLDGSGISHPTAKSSPDVGRSLSSKDAEENLPKSAASHHAIPRGINFLPAGKSVVVESSYSAPGSSSLTTNGGLRAINQNNQRASSATENLEETPKRTPAAVPKGINFLSFGKGSLEISGAQKLTYSSGAKPSLSDKFDAHKQSSFPLTMGIDTRVRKETDQNIPSSTPGLNKMLQKTQVTMSPLKSNILSFSGSATNESTCNTRDNLPSSSAALVDRSRQASEILPEKDQNLKTISQGKLASTPGSSQSTDYWQISCQKSLVSTLAFAAKVESQMSMKQTTVIPPAANSRADNGTGDCGIFRESQNTARALKILDFLSNVGDKTKQ